MAALRYRYRTYEFGSHDIHLRTLRDNQQFQDTGGEAADLDINDACWPHFGIVWASGEVLAHLLMDMEVAGKRILEIGCGIALPSMVLNHRQADITATDHHPAAEAFLKYNTSLNEEPDIPFVRTGWKNPVDTLGRFDLLVGSDILYEQDHVGLLSGFIDRHANAECEIILVDPGRHQHARFSRKMISLGYSHSKMLPGNTPYLDKAFKGRILRYRRSPGL